MTWPRFVTEKPSAFTEYVPAPARVGHAGMIILSDQKFHLPTNYPWYFWVFCVAIPCFDTRYENPCDLDKITNKALN